MIGKVKGFFMNNIGIISFVIVVVVAFLICGIIIAVQRGNNQQLREDIKTIEEQAEKEIAEIRKEAEDAKKQAEIRIENMPADAVALEFLSDEDVLARADIVDGIAKEILEHQLRFFREMGIDLVRVRSEGVR